MTLDDCLALAPGPPCGYKGACDEIEKVCVCEKGWTQSTEFALYLSADEFESENSTQRLLCDTNNTLLLALYSFALTLTLYTVLSHLLKIKKKRQLKRLAPFLIGYMCTILYCCLRIADMDRKLGQDLSTTLLLAVQHLLTSIGSLVFYNKFIAYQAKSIPLASFGVEKKAFKAEHLKKVQNFIVLVDIASASCMAIAAFSESWKLDVIALKLFLGTVSGRMIYSIWADIYYVNLILFDIKQLFKLAGSKSILNDGTTSDNEAKMKKLRENIKGLNNIKNVTVAFNLVILVFYIPPLIWPRFLSIFKYFIPLGFVSGALTALIVLLAHNAKNRKFGSKDSSQVSVESTMNPKSSVFAKPVSSITVTSNSRMPLQSEKKTSGSKSRASKTRTSQNRASKNRSSQNRGTFSRTLGRKTKNKIDERVDISLFSKEDDDDKFEYVNR